MKPRKIKTKMLILLIGLTFFISIIFYILIYFLGSQLRQNLNNEIYSSLNRVKKQNQYLINNDLLSFSKDYLASVVNSIYNSIIYNKDILPKLNDNGEINVNKLLSNQNIKEIIANSVSINGEKVADFAIIQNKKIVICSLVDDQGNPINSFQVWLNKYNILRKYFSENSHNNNIATFTTDNNIFLIVRRLPGTDCYIIGSINSSKIKQNTSNAIQSNNVIFMLENNLKKNINDSMSLMTYYRILVIVIVLLLCIPLAIINAAKITKPIIKLRDEVKKISEGNFTNSKIEEKGSIEIVDLIKSFNTLGGELDSYMNNLKKEVKEREKLESEIKIAAQIQISSLPNITSEFIRPEFSLAAKLSPAQFAAGDFYDFFYITKNKLALVIADVSGKGISAAFYMSLAKATLSSISQHETSPAKAMEKTNHIISENNINSMFVTTFLMFYDINTGIITYANAGHHDAIVYSNNKERIRTFGQCHNPSMGLLPHISFDEHKDKLEPGDTLILYTDGATEAINPKEEMYGEEKLFDLISENNSQPVNELANTITTSIRKYEEGSLFDDLTLLVFRRNK
ncbi:MAG: PP2C family protein-serine/threonine phosphatase [bacterium]|nr:PP2C family protein-serine/threonine phosphatase [bacterium]